MSVSTLNINLDFDKLLDAYKSLNIDELLKSSQHQQISVQCRPECPVEKQLYQGTGSLMYDWTDYDNQETLVKIENKFKQFEFTEICEYFKGTYIEEIINIISKEYPICRSRFMMSLPKTCLSTHSDPTQRIHIPIYTNQNCYMVFTDKVCRMVTGNVYKVDTTHDHTAVNASLQFRTHLVMCIR